MPNYNTQLQSNNTDLQAILNTINELPEAGSGTQATPEISVNSTNGLITAIAGTKSSTYQLAFQPAKTITPKTTDQVAVSSGYYTGGVIKVKGDANLVAGNIKSGVSIFGVSGTLEEGSGSGEQVEWSANEDAIINKTITNYTNNRVTSVGSYAFYSYSSLTSVNFPACITIGESAFRCCSSLTSANFPACTIIDYGAFYDCRSLTTVNFPACTTINKNAFYQCTNLKTISFPTCITVGDSAFYYCSLKTIDFSACTQIEYGAFRYCQFLISANFPACTTVGTTAFEQCYSLKTISFPTCTSIGNKAFRNCNSLISANFPACTTVGTAAFELCVNLKTISFPTCITVGDSAFNNCCYLKSIYFIGSSVCTLNHSNAFDSTPIGGYSEYTKTYGSIYVPASLLTQYQTATNWAYFSSRFVGI